MSFSREQIIDRVYSIITAWVPEAEADGEITEATNLITDLGLDSIGVLQVVLGIEKEFTITIDNSELDSEVFKRMGNLVNLIEGKIYEAD